MMRQVSRFLVFLLFSGFFGWANSADTPSTGLGNLPATFEGVLPCASCEGIQTRLTLRADHTYFLTRVYLGMVGPNRATDLGRWVMTSDGKVVIKGQEADERYFSVISSSELRMLDVDGNTILSTQNYNLVRAASPAEFDLKLFPLNGMYRQVGNAAYFTECSSGLEFTVAKSGDNQKLEQAYAQARQQEGQPVYATLYGQVRQARPSQGNPVDSSLDLSLEPLRFESISNTGACPVTHGAKTLRG